MTTATLPAAPDLAARNLGLVHALARRYARHGVLDFDELCTEGSIALVYAAQGYDPRCGTRFATYAVPGIARRMMHACRRRLRRPLPQSPEGGRPALERLEAPADARPTPGPCGADLEAAFATLSGAQALVVRLKHGLTGWRTHSRGKVVPLPALSFGEIARRLRRDVAAVRKLYRRALVRLKREAGGDGDG